MKNIRAFTVIEILIVVLALVGVTGFGYLFVSKMLNNQQATNTITTTVSDITSTSDIDTVSSQLESINLDSDSSSALTSLESSLNSF